MTAASARPQAVQATGRRAGRAGWSVHPATVALIALMVASGALLLYAGRHLTFFYDEWVFVFTRRGASVDSYLDPHNGHLVLFPVIVYKILFSLFGLRHYTPYRIVGVALHLLCGGLLYVLVRRRLGHWLALVAAALLLFMGTAWQDLLWPFQMSYLASAATGLGALALLERQDARGDAGASVLLIWSLASSGVGVPFLVACAVALIAQRSGFKRLWIVAVPAVLYALWYLGWASGEQITSDAILGTPQYVSDAAAGTVSGIAGLDAGWGPPLTVALAATVAVAWRRRHGAALTPMLLAAAGGALTFWILAALTRSDSPDPTASRYLYVGALFIVLVAAELAVGTRLSKAGLALTAALVLAAVIGNLGALRAGERGLREGDDSVRSSLAALEVAAPVVSPAFTPQPVDAPQITAGPYLAAVRELGSPALSLTELERAPESTRESADQVLEHAEALALVPTTHRATGTRPVSVSSANGGRISAEGRCEHFTPTSASATVDAAVQPGTELSVQAVGGQSALLYLRRFATEFSPPPFATAIGVGQSVIRFPLDRAPGLDWHVRAATSGAIVICAS
jgi:hypothetical protein